MRNIQLGELSDVSVVPANLMASAIGNVTFGFTVANEIPANGIIEINLPNGFNTAAATGTYTVNGTNYEAVGDPNVPLITLTGDGNGSGITAAANFTISGIQNPSTVADTSVGSIYTYDSLLSGRDYGEIAAMTITPPPPPLLVAATIVSAVTTIS